MDSIVLLSGGLDSTVLASMLVKLGHRVRALGVNYGQRHERELSAGARVAEALGIEYRVAHVSNLMQFLQGSALTSSHLDVPEGHYEEESMKLTVVPNRNMLLLSIATAWAISEKADAIYYAAHLGDHAIYPDCRKVFVDKMREAIALADWHSVELFAPFEEQTKADIVRHGVNVSAPMELSWSCYKGGAKHCGKCGTCVERREAFQLAEVQDPTEYEGE